MKILVTGGAGYIGSHVAKILLLKNYKVVILDNLSTGSISAVEILGKKYALSGDFLEFIRGDLSDKELLSKIFHQTQIDAVVHLAAKINVQESIENEPLYFEENYLNGANLIEAMSEVGTNKIIFSSTAAVYGNPKYLPIDENHPTSPLNPYGQIKLDFEKYLRKVENLKFVILRYFNVGGSDLNGFLGKSHLQNEDVIENAIKVALGQKNLMKIYGTDYQTQDGSAIRDFVHVEDIALAHLLALEKINEISNEVFNLGSEKGFSVKEIVDKVSLISGKEIETECVSRRQADIAVSIASSHKAKELLGWQAQHCNLDEIIESDWHWRRSHPQGYN